MRITALGLSGDVSWPNLELDCLDPQLNLLYAPPRGGKSTLAHLIGHLLYGKSEGAWRAQFGQSLPPAAGSVSVASHSGSYLLRRHFDNLRTSRLTIAGLHGTKVDSQTTHTLLGNLSPALAAKLYVADFAASPRLETLLVEDFAQALTSPHAQQLRQSELPTQNENHFDRRRIEELVAHRDEIAAEIEQQLATRRYESSVLEGELETLAGAQDKLRLRITAIRAELDSIESQISQQSIALRYFGWEDSVRSKPAGWDDAGYRSELGELDREITDCRETLKKLQRREANVSTQLVDLQPDGTVDRNRALGDSRATLGIVEKLLDEVDVELSEWKRKCEQQEADIDVHARVSPLVTLLKHHAYALCGQLTEQERSVQREAIERELCHLQRVQSELRDRLEDLLQQRERFVQTAEQNANPTHFAAQLPVPMYCHCRRHQEFVADSGTDEFSWHDRNTRERQVREELAQLQAKRRQMGENIRNLQEKLRQQEERWTSLQKQRKALLAREALSGKYSELDRLETLIGTCLSGENVASDYQGEATWRASDILATLTDGQYTQVRWDSEERTVTLTDAAGNHTSSASLSAELYDQLYVALTLSLVDRHAQQNLHLPLVLDEPFLRQNADAAARLASVLQEFSRRGHQLFVFTEDRNVRRRLETLRATVFDLEYLHKPIASDPLQSKQDLAIAPATKTRPRLVRETRDGRQAPALRLAIPEGSQDADALYFLTEQSSLEDFPVLGSETSEAFTPLGLNTVGDLLTADAAEVSKQLQREDVHANTVRLWQTHMTLMCYVPALTCSDAQLLTAVGVYSPEELANSAIDVLQAKISDFLRTDRVGRFSASENRYSRGLVEIWIQGAARQVDRWREARKGLSPSSNKHSPPPVNQEDRPTATVQSKWHYYLNLESDIEAAPSVGPKTASRLAEVGIHTVADFLNVDPESTAVELNVSHITATKLSNWQHQARLVCQMPELRGYGAQLLVACGYTHPEQIAKAAPEVLVKQVRKLCRTKKGERILRCGAPPSREEITRWIELATHHRPLEAA